jgi:hypothetical protein
VGDTGARCDEVPCQWAILGVLKVQDRFHGDRGGVRHRDHPVDHGRHEARLDPRPPDASIAEPVAVTEGSRTRHPGWKAESPGRRRRVGAVGVQGDRPDSEESGPSAHSGSTSQPRQPSSFGGPATSLGKRRPSHATANDAADHATVIDEPLIIIGAIST